MPAPRSVAIVGAGLMGHALAQVFAVANAEVRIHDPDAGVLRTVTDRVAANLKRLECDLAPAHRIVLCQQLQDAVADAELVIEAAPENPDLKRSIFATLDALSPADAILATNTSVIPIAQIAKGASRRERVIGTHWWNPPYLVPLVEVVPTSETSEATVSRTLQMLRDAGKTPVHVRRDVPGFVGNRLQHALWREAIALVAEGVCDAETVDTVVKQSFGLRLPVLGPLENADLVGLDLTLAIHEHVLPHIDCTPQASPYLRRLVDEGKLGMKSGRGFRIWAEGEPERVRGRLSEHLRSAAPTGAGPAPAESASGSDRNRLGG